jgi:hypothetical protein
LHCEEIEVNDEDRRITVGRLREELSGYRATDEITFGCTMNGDPLVFYRVKRRGPDLAQIELNELMPEP